MCLEGNAGAMLVTLAREAVHLFGSEAAKLIRQCESPSCTLYFVDISRRGDRRWCSMSACGNKAKVRELRHHRTPRNSTPFVESWASYANEASYSVGSLHPLPARRDVQRFFVYFYE